MTSSYLEYLIDDPNIQAFKKNKCKWSPCSNYLAISVGKNEFFNSIIFVNKDGELLEQEDFENNSKLETNICDFEWHPKLPVLACFWTNLKIGTFCFNNEFKKWYFKEADQINNKIENEKLKSFDLNKCLFSMDWLNEGKTICIINLKNEVIFFDFNVIENTVKQDLNIIQLDDQITNVVSTHSIKSSSLFISCNSFCIYQIKTENKVLKEVIKKDCLIYKLIYYKNKSRLLVLDENFVLSQFNMINDEFNEVSSNLLETFSKSEKYKNYLKNNCTFNQDKIFILMVDENIGIIAICICGERVIRLFQIDSGQSVAVIAIKSTDHNWAGVNTLIYNDFLRKIVSATSNNHLIVWNKVLKEYSLISEKPYSINDNNNLKYNPLEFKKTFQTVSKKSINCLSLSNLDKIAYIADFNELVFVDKQELIIKFYNGLFIFQETARKLNVLFTEENQKTELILENNIKDIFISPNRNLIAIKTSKFDELIIFKLKKQYSYELFTKVQIENFEIILQNTCFWQLNLDLNHSKTINESITLNCFDVNNKNEQKQNIYLLDFKNLFKSTDKIRLVCIDFNSDFLLLIFKNQTQSFEYCYVVYNLLDQHTNISCEMTKFHFDQNILNAKINSNGTLIVIYNKFSFNLIEVSKNRLNDIKIQNITTVYFDSNEPRLLSIQNENLIYILLCTISLKKNSFYAAYYNNDSKSDDLEYQIYDCKKFEKELELIGFQIPYLYVIEDKSQPIQLKEEHLTEFKNIKLDTIKIIIDFLTSKTITLHAMVKSINLQGEDNENLWQNLARISVKCRNIEIGLYCMSKLKNLRVIRDIQHELNSKSCWLSQDDKKNLALAVLAINVNLFNEAENLFKTSVSSNDRLVRYYQNRNEWNKAMHSVEKLNEKSLFYNYAKYLEIEQNEIKKAIEFYERSGTSDFEVTRMLFDLNEVNELKNYCLDEKMIKENKKSKELVKWWGQYCESLGDLQEAIKIYRQANDHYNLIRLLCYTGDVDQAKSILKCNKDNTKNDHLLNLNNDNSNLNMNAAILFLGKYLENSKPVESINYYLSCGAINHAINTCKTNHLDEQLVKIIENFGTKSEILDLVNKLEENEENYESLLHLYLKIDDLDNSLKMGFKGRLWNYLRYILDKKLNELNLDNLDNQNSSINKISDETIQISLNLLENNSQIIDIVMNLLLLKGDQKNLIKDLILKYKIEINDEFIDKIEKIFKLNETNNQELNAKKFLVSLAELSLIQKQFLISAKLYNSIGDRINSIKSLIRSGNVEKIVNYATLARDKNVYKLASIYLQSINEDKEIIEKFNKKAGAKRN